ncbi:hypothetical protein CROQUDRAFT_89713 [Cronartium quercuum f. sp. fusiforme G11]|uniref:Uncharacterized protein n=1 Tax=Cronartium quercuum f. sp. fusiforme G11 TaxID=708437 RepID=A0A9P6NMZ4_9BASI|nr:hypothetical protein CROQUDRAFT_89713 [Cronartium quercuum f. sp. fusiforme G11]
MPKVVVVAYNFIVQPSSSNFPSKSFPHSSLSPCSVHSAATARYHLVCGSADVQIDVLLKPPKSTLAIPIVQHPAVSLRELSNQPFYPTPTSSTCSITLSKQFQSYQLLCLPALLAFVLRPSALESFKPCFSLSLYSLQIVLPLRLRARRSVYLVCLPRVHHSVNLFSLGYFLSYFASNPTSEEPFQEARFLAKLNLSALALHNFHGLRSSLDFDSYDSKTLPQKIIRVLIVKHPLGPNHQLTVIKTSFNCET